MKENLDTFEYGGYHFKPCGQFDRTWNKVTIKTRTDSTLGMNDKPDAKVLYNRDKFLEASTDRNADIYRCLENGKLYTPLDHDLSIYVTQIIDKSCKPKRSKQHKERER